MSEENDNENEITAGQLVYNNMKIYANESIEATFSSCIDGLGNVGRRILYVARNFKSNEKLHSLVADTSKYHVHGDVSIRDSMDNNVRPWKTRLPLLTYIGSYGSYAGDNSAATRYLDVRLSDIANDVFFKYTDFNVLNMVPAFSGFGLEPKHFIPCIPTALTSNNQAMAPGFRFLTIPISINSACEIVKSFVKLKKKNPLWNKRRTSMNNLIRHLIPDLPVPSLIRNTTEVYNEYMNGNFNVPVIMDGIIEVTKTTIVVKTIPTGEIVNKQRQIEQIEMPNNGSWYHKYFNKYDGSAEGDLTADHSFTLKRGVDPFEVLDIVKQFYGFTQSVRQYRNWLNPEGKKQEMTPVQILEAWYDERYRAVCNQLRIEQSALLAQIRRYHVLILALENSKKIHELFKESESSDEAAEKVIEFIPELTKMQAKFIFDLSFKSLPKNGRVEFEEKITQAKEKLKQVNSDLLEVDNVLIRNADSIKKTYGEKLPTSYVYKNCEFDRSDRISKIPTFLYVCHVRNVGFIQCFNIKDIEEVMRVHDYDKVKIIGYSSWDVEKYIVDLTDRVITEEGLDLPQIFSGRYLTTSVKENKLKNTVVIDQSEKTIMYFDHLIYNHSKLQKRDLYFVGDQVTAIHRTGEISIINITELPLRKNLNSAGNQSTIKFVSACTDPDLYIVYINKSYPSVVMFETTTSGIVNVGHEVEMLYMGSDDNIVVSMNDFAYNRTMTHHLFIDNVKKIFGSGNKVSLSLSSLKFSIADLKSNSMSINRYIKKVIVD